MMKNNYSLGCSEANSTNYSIFKKTAAAFKITAVSIIILASAGLNNLFSQVTITAPSLTLTACSAFPTNSGNLGDIVITEIAAGDISGSGTLILTAPANFEFTSAGTASATGTEITGVSSVLTDAVTITLSLTVGGTAELNAITLSGIQIRGITAATAVSDVARTGGTSVINGDGNAAVHATLTSLLGMPALSSTLTPAPICSGTVFNYAPTSIVSGAAFTWTRAAVVGISNTANSGTGDPNEILNNTTANPVNVTYVYTVSADGCTNPSTYNVVLTVNPSPSLSSLLSPPAICSGSDFNYTLASATTGTTFSWSVIQTNVTGASVGSGSAISQTLTATGAAPGSAVYTVTLTANGCTSAVTAAVTASVNPMPSLSSSLTPPPICGDSSSTFSYTPTSGTSGATFAWTRAVVTGISNAAGSGSGSINETLNDISSSPVNVTYVFSVTANGCTNPTTFSVVVAVSICACHQILTSTLTPPPICSGSNFNYAPTSDSTGATFAWTRALTAGISNVSGAGTGNPNETLINTTASSINVTYVFSITVNGCTNPVTHNVVVKVNPSPSLSSSLTPPAVCSHSTFNYAPASLTTGATFAWTRVAATGISNIAGSGSGHANEILINTTSSPVNVTYVYSVTANGCTNPTTFSVVVTVNPLPTVSLAPFTPVCMQAPPFTLTGGAPAGGTYSGTGVDSIGKFHPASAGAIQAIVYTVTNTFNCSNSASQNMTVNACAGVEENNISGILIFPNPTNGMLTLAVKNPAFTELQISVVDIQGKEVFNNLYKNVSAGYNKQINLDGFAKGIYFIKMNTGSDIQIQKLIIQ